MALLRVVGVPRDAIAKWSTFREFVDKLSGVKLN